MDQKRENTSTNSSKERTDLPDLERKVNHILGGGLLLESSASDPDNPKKGSTQNLHGDGGGLNEEEEVLVSDIKTPEDLAPYLVSVASKKAAEVSKEVTEHSYFFREFLYYRSSSPLGDLPTPYVISHSPQINGVFEFKYNNEEEMFNQLIKYTKGVFGDRIKKAFSIPEDAELKVNLFGTEVYSELIGRPRKYKNIVFPVYLAALMLEKESNHKVLAEDLLGIEIKLRSKDQGYIVELSNAKSGLDSLPGFRIELQASLNVRKYDEHEKTSYFFYPTKILSPRHRVLFNMFFYVSLFDYLFGYSRETKTLSPVYYRLDEEYLRNLYATSGRFDNDSYVLREIKEIHEELSEIEKNGENLEEAKIQSIISSGKYPGLNSLSEFIKLVWKDYLVGIFEDPKRSDKSSLSSTDYLNECVSALLILFSLSEIESEILKKRDLLKELTGKSFSSITVKDLPFIFSRISEKVAFQKFAEKPSVYINRQRRALQNLAKAKVPRETVVAVTSFFDSFVLDTIRYLRYSGVDGISFKFGGRAPTAMASRGKNRKGEDVYSLHFNPYFLVRESIVHSIDLDVLFSTVMFHEFVHVRLRHLKLEIKSLGHDQYISEVPKELSDLVPGRLDNIHQDVYINFISAKMAEYFAKAKYPYGDGQSLSHERRIKAFMNKSFYYSELEDYNLPKIYVTSTPSGTEVSGGIVSPNPSLGKDDTYNKIRFYSTAYKLAIPNIICFARSPKEALDKYVYKKAELSVEGEDLATLLRSRDMVGLGSLLRIIAIIVHEVTSAHSTALRD